MTLFVEVYGIAKEVFRLIHHLIVQLYELYRHVLTALLVHLFHATFNRPRKGLILIDEIASQIIYFLHLGYEVPRNGIGIMEERRLYNFDTWESFSNLFNKFDKVVMSFFLADTKKNIVVTAIEDNDRRSVLDDDLNAIVKDAGSDRPSKARIVNFVRSHISLHVHPVSEITISHHAYIAFFNGYWILI
jgi:hypothetical protein